MTRNVANQAERSSATKKNVRERYMPTKMPRDVHFWLLAQIPLTVKSERGKTKLGISSKCQGGKIKTKLLHSDLRASKKTSPVGKLKWLQQTGQGRG